MKKLLGVLLTVLFVLLVFHSLGAQKIKMVDGVKVILNGKKPTAPKGRPVTIKLTEELVIGLSDNPDEALSEVGLFVVDKDGNLFVVDSKDRKVKAFDRNGRFLRLIGKPGEGPGELGMPTGVQFTPAGELMVEDATNRRLSFFKPSGEFIRSASIADKMGLLSVLLDGQGNCLGREIGLSGNKMFFEIKKYDLQLKPLFSLDKIDFPVPLPGSGAKINLMELSSIYQFDAAGNIFYGRNVAYEIKVFSPQGKHIRSIQKEYDQVKVTQEDIDEILARIPTTGDGVTNIKDMFVFPDYFPPFQFFLLDDQGRMYVRTYKKGKAKGEYEIDVFDAEGTFIAQFITKAGLMIWRGDKAYGIEDTEDGFRVIKRYAVSWQ
ncbi:MAG: 6-bladed beta-propeller [Clostridiales bacterium]|nr:6-bladed beta-propeller [Clostridiales bacterium]